jgi:hypothetical protein
MAEQTSEQPQRTSNTQDSLRDLAEHVRESGAVEGATLLEEWERRQKTGELLTERDLQDRIAQIEQNIDSLKYSSALERTMYHTVLERMRLRLQMRHGRIDLGDPQDRHDLEVLKDLNRRITYAQYEEAAVDEILDSIEDYENYREEFKLNRSEEEGGVPRSVELETHLREQLIALNVLLPKMGEVRKLRYYEYQLSKSPNDPVLSARVIELRAAIPAEFAGDSKRYYDALDQQLRDTLGTSSPQIQQKKLTTPLAHELHREAIERHFDAVLARRKALTGKTGPGIEMEKEGLKDEHCRLLDHALNYNAQSLSRLTGTIGLLSMEGHIHQPVADPDAVSTTEQGFGLLGDREALARERDRKISDMEAYIRHFREDVLRGDHRIDVPIVGDVLLDPTLIMEDIMTTHVIPAKMQLAEPHARWATVPWEIQDALLGAVGLDWDIRGKRTRAILAPIYERLGLPENYSELSAEEKEQARNSPVVQARLRSVKTIINEFRAQEGAILDAMQSDVTLLRQLLVAHPPQDLALSMEPNIPTELPDITALKTGEDIAGAYVFLLDRISTTRVAELNAAQRTFITKINENLSLNIDVADIEKQLATAWIREWPLSIGLLFGEAIGAYVLVRHGVPAAIRHSPRLLRGSARAARGTGSALRSAADGTTEALRAARSSEAAKELTKMRYIKQERAIAQYLQNSKVGQRVSQLKTFRFLSTASKSKAVAGTGRVLSGAAILAVPAITAYELVENEGNVRAAEKGNNADLANVYRGNRSTIALEGAGVGATLLMPGLLGPLALAGAVVYAGKHTMNRTEVRADWARTAADWQTEYGPIGSRQKIRDATFANAVKAGGGGALRTRIGSVFESAEERDKAIASIDQAQIATRREIYQAYFESTALVPASAAAEDRRNAVSDRMTYVRIITNGRFDEVNDTQLQLADAFAELKARARAMEKMGFPAMLSYVDREGNPQYIDLQDLNSTTLEKISPCVMQFTNEVRPLEDLLAFEALGDMTRRTNNTKDLAEQRLNVRRAILQRLSHRFLNAERSIAVTDWSGVDLPFGITKGNTNSQNIVRVALRKRIEMETGPLVDQLMNGDLSPDAYKGAVQKIEKIFIEFQNAGDTNARLEAATKELSVQEKVQAESAQGSVLLELLP